MILGTALLADNQPPDKMAPPTPIFGPSSPFRCADAGHPRAGPDYVLDPPPGKILPADPQAEQWKSLNLVSDING
jgi:hypothetical protein